jgi:hypothetical protein
MTKPVAYSKYSPIMIDFAPEAEKK